MAIGSGIDIRSAMAEADKLRTPDSTLVRPIRPTLRTPADYQEEYTRLFHADASLEEKKTLARAYYNAYPDSFIKFKKAWREEITDKGIQPGPSMYATTPGVGASFLAGVAAPYMPILEPVAGFFNEKIRPASACYPG